MPPPNPTKSYHCPSSTAANFPHLLPAEPPSYSDLLQDMDSIAMNQLCGRPIHCWDWHPRCQCSRSSTDLSGVLPPAYPTVSTASVDTDGPQRALPNCRGYRKHSRRRSNSHIPLLVDSLSIALMDELVWDKILRPPHCSAGFQHFRIQYHPAAHFGMIHAADTPLHFAASLLSTIRCLV